MTTTNGSFTTDETRIIQGTGEVEFTENGTFVSDGLASVVDFTGTFTRTISDKRTYVANGTWNGSGEIKASWIDLSNFESVSECNVDANDATNITMPENQTLCLKNDTGDLPIYMLDGEIMADGRFTSDGTTVLTQELEGALLKESVPLKELVFSMEQVSLRVLVLSPVKWSILVLSIKQDWFRANTMFMLT